MMQSLGMNFSKYRRFLPLSATILLFSIAYVVGAFFYSGMRDSQVFFTLFITSPFLLINAIGETFVIISGGIDLSVSGMVALTSTASAALLRAGWNPWMVMLLIGIVHAHVLPAVEAAGLGDCIPIAILLSFLFGGSVSSKN